MRTTFATLPAAAIVLLAGAGLAFAAYTPYVSDPLTSINSSNWYQNGSLTAGSTGITSSSGGALVSKTAAPTYPNDYMVVATINLPNNTSGGNYGVMVRASTNALSSPATGSYYLVEIQNPTFSNGTCSATLAVTRTVNGSPYSVYSGSTWCASSFQLSVTINGAGIQWFINGQFTGSTSDSSIATGQPGISVRGAPAGNTMSAAFLFPGDHTAPSSIDRNNISTTSYANRIDMQWKAPADDPNGSGLSLYIVYRGSTELNAFADNLGEFTDNSTSLAPGTQYTYNIISCDAFYNCSNSVFNASTAPVGSIDPRQIGMPPNGTNWGGGGENINILSGNLNYSLPLLKAQGRGGSSLGIGLNYNSQNWRLDGSGTWNYGRDTGYGWGFRVLAGSIQEFYNGNWGVDHWEFTDSTGTQYRLDQQVMSIANPTPTASNTGIWATTTDSATFLYNANSSQLYFPNGTVWTFGCESLGNEGDATAKYPTQIEDSNGNQILIRYEPGLLAVNNGVNVFLGFGNSSGRIAQIEDVRATQLSGGGYATYLFNYNNDAGVPHLTSITNNIQTSEGYSFTYNEGTGLTSPWGAGFGTATQLASITIAGIGLQYQLSYDGASELTKVIFPYQGWISWQYGEAGYSGSRSQNEVTGRTLSMNGTTQYGYPFTTAHDSNNTMRQTVTLNDAGGVGQKVWTFNAVAGTGAAAGLLNTYKGNDLSSGTAVTLQQVNTGWTTAPFGDYMWSISTTMNPGTSNATTKLVTQTLDQFGNMTQMLVDDYSGNLLRTYQNTYLSTSGYTALYIRNRLSTSTVTPNGGSATTLASNLYDGYGGTMVSAYAPREFDQNYTTSYTTRGNVVSSTTPNGTTNYSKYDNTGNVLQTTNALGVVTSDNSSSTTNYAAPSSITTGSLTSTFQYASNLLPTQAQGPNGDTTSALYDQYARPSSTTSSTGAVTYYNYINSPAETLSYTNPNNNSVGRVTATFLDGFGRTITQQSGTGTYMSGTITMKTVTSQVDTTYAPCGCSPLGKLSSVTRPHAPGVTNGGITTYAYDGIGRTVSVTSGGTDSSGSTTSGMTTYVYAGATVTIYDPAHNSKIFTTDPVGNLTQVSEPNPAGGANLLTNYTYSVLGQLITVNMPRSTGTQNRSFNYGTIPGGSSAQVLLSATNPENGTVTNTYNADNTLNYKVDAKAQKIQYSYDSYKRVTQISKFPAGAGEDLCQRVNYYYDTNPFISTSPYNQYTSGRLTAITYAGANCTFIPSQYTSTTGNNYIEMYAYSQAGQITNKRFRLWKQTGTTTGTTISADLEAVYTYDQEGKVASVQYPLGTTYQYGYDNLGRPISMEDMQASSYLVSSATYGPAGELLSMTGAAVGETRTYNALGQLKTLTGLNGVNLQYTYSSTANNGQIASQYDVQSGETITYQYDQLKRLSSATSSQGWNQNFSYDGFGNLTAKTGSGIAPVGTYAVNAATNQLSNTLYDANGNQLAPQGVLSTYMAYDVSNRMVSASGLLLGKGAAFEYDPKNRRVYQAQESYNGSAWVTTAQLYYFYGLNGKKIGTYTAAVNGTTLAWSLQSTQVFFKGRLIKDPAGNEQMDVRGSVGKYYPYGENRGTPAADAVQFATYTGDSMTGLDYAVNRFYQPGVGRFASPDPYIAITGGEAEPGSWNRYAYTRGDPINRIDFAGTCDTSNDGDYSVTVCADPPDGPTTVVINPGQLCGSQQSSGCYYGNINAAQAKAWVLPPPVTFSQTEEDNLLASAIQEALKLLEDDTQCSALFTTGTAPVNPQDLLTDLYTGTAYGVINTSTLGPGLSATVGSPSNPTLIAGGGLAQVVVTVTNASSTTWGGSTLVDAQLILHELAHAYNDIWAGSVPSISNDSMSATGSTAAQVSASQANQNTIAGACH